MPSCGSQITICDLPIRFDTYKGCEHDCKYCFVQRKTDISNVEKRETTEALIKFIKGKRTKETNWCDWGIPLHWGGMSDPFQPAEKNYRLSYECLKIFAKTKYPVVVSTKGKLIADKEYLELVKQCNIVVQVSLVSPLYDRIEKGAPTFEERLEIVRKLVPNCKRVIVRIQPYIREAKKDILTLLLPKLSEYGVYGITLEGMKNIRKVKGFDERIGADFCYPKEILKKDFLEIKKKANALGIKCFMAENRLRKYGDGLCCCGVGDLEGFKVNKYNLNHIYFDKEQYSPSKAMLKENSCECFSSSMQITAVHSALSKMSFKECMDLSIKDINNIKALGV
ncbi:radical SAM protein [Hathewaya histolytica]|uniref:radical SAM protein n=1 Tax=Hathewaya histolytica TaxID=1498 RepID=UPI003B67B052